MEDSEEDELLNLSLSFNRERKNKGKTITRENNNVSMMSSTNRNPYEGYEGKIFRLLQMREQMLRKNTLNIEDSNGLPIIHLLLTTATSVDENNFDSSLENLTDLYQIVSLTGDSVQRVVAYFTDGLTAKLLTKKSPFYEMLMEEPTIDEEFLAFTDLYRVSPYYQFAHFTANQVILETFEKEEEKNNRSIHVIDFDVSYGFQWPSLIQSLSEKATSGNKISLRITGFAMFDSLDDCLPLESIERLRIEKKVFGKEIKSMLNNYDVDDGVGVECAKYEKMETWKSRMENHGFVGMKMSSKCLIQAKLLLKMRTNYCPLQFEEESGGGGGGGGGGFRVSERDDGKAISLGWQNRFLLTVSAWQSL
ncbi:hypothetical protein P8452_04501 [Trifolium repens]|nr:hypothetical protein P8452_04501 [Trifolium repens]